MLPSTSIFNSPALQHYLNAIFYNNFPQKDLTGVKYSLFVFMHDVYCYWKDMADTDGVYVADMLMVKLWEPRNKGKSLRK